MVGIFEQLLLCSSSYEHLTMKILIICGGISSEREISLISAEAIKNGLEATGYQAILFDFKQGYSELEKILENIDLIFPIMHGKEGEDGKLYRFLHSTGKPFIGSDPDGARMAFDKILFKKYCNQRKLQTARWKIIKNSYEIESFGFPCVLKAANGGSSHEVMLLHSEQDLQNPQVKTIFSLDDHFYVETLLSGVEITIGVLGQQVFPVMEIVPPEKGWFDYQNKYSGESQEIPFAPSVKKDIQEDAQSIALQIHQELRLGSYSRADFIVVDGVPFILEINTPGGVGFTPESLFPKAAKAIGMSFEELVKKIVESV